jgi:hypothetical protein
MWFVAATVALLLCMATVCCATTSSNSKQVLNFKSASSPISLRLLCLSNLDCKDRLTYAC